MTPFTCDCKLTFCMAHAIRRTGIIKHEHPNHFHWLLFLILFAGGWTSNRLAPAEQQEPINHSDHGVGTNAFDSSLGLLAVTFALDQIELLYSLTRLHHAESFESALKGHLFAALDIVEANERLFPSTIAAVQTNQDFIAATAYRRADLWTNQDVVRVSSGSPLRDSEAEIMHLAKVFQWLTFTISRGWY